ncbi:hypothetical protein [Streptomyces sp. 7N604]|uniref:hypothetical protein n=1 Tax=Streptomyces sp. 7N604 TaxID=3457415 RepID=UPI003FD5D94E
MPEVARSFQSSRPLWPRASAQHDQLIHGETYHARTASANGIPWTVSWKLVRTPECHFPDPVPPEPGAYLSDVVALPGDVVRAYGEHTFNHGEVDNEPADEYIRLDWNGTRWTKQPDAKGDCAGRVPAVRDGERVLL